MIWTVICRLHRGAVCEPKYALTIPSTSLYDARHKNPHFLVRMEQYLTASFGIPLRAKTADSHEIASSIVKLETMSQHSLLFEASYGLQVSKHYLTHNTEYEAFYRTLENLESLSVTRGYFLEDDKRTQTHLLVLCDAVGCNIASLAQYPITDSEFLTPRELNDFASRLGDLTKSLRTQPKKDHSQEQGGHTSRVRTGTEDDDSEEAYIASLKGLDDVLGKIYGEWSRRLFLFPNEKFEGAKETLAKCLQDWAEQNLGIHEDCETVFWKLDALMLMALERLRMEAEHRPGL